MVLLLLFIRLRAPGVRFLYHYLPRMAYTWVFMPVTYYFNRALAIFLRERE